MGTGKADPDNHKKEGETDNHPEGTRLGHYVLGMLAIFKICSESYSDNLSNKIINLHFFNFYRQSTRQRNIWKSQTCKSYFDK